jgi:hypothetical protein
MRRTLSVSDPHQDWRTKKLTAGELLLRLSRRGSPERSPAWWRERAAREVRASLQLTPAARETLLRAMLPSLACSHWRRQSQTE